MSLDGLTLIAAVAQIHLPLAYAALPREEPKEREEGTLEHTVSRKTTKLVMTTPGTDPHFHLNDYIGCNRRPLEMRTTLIVAATGTRAVSRGD